MASSGGIRQREPQRPTLFLDYDGVLHPDAVYREGERIVLRADGFRLFEWVDVLEDLLTPYPALQVVLSTSWVRVLGFDAARSRLPEFLRRRVVGATGYETAPRRWDNLTRYEQIGMPSSDIAITTQLSTGGPRHLPMPGNYEKM